MASKSSESMYKGGDSTLEPFNDFSTNYGHFTGFNRLKGSQIGFSGNPATANQLGEVTSAIRQGTKVFEVSFLGIQGDPDQVIPKQHLDEMRAIMKLTGVKPSVHGPLMDAAGFGERGWGGEDARAQNERRMFDAVERAKVIGPKENIVVNFHTGNAGGYTDLYVPDEKDKTKAKIDKMAIINLETNQTGYVEEAGQYSLGTSKEEFEAGKKNIHKGGSRLTSEYRLNSQNSSSWRDKFGEVTLAKRYADQTLQDAIASAQGLELANINIKDKKGIEEYEKQQLKRPEASAHLQNQLTKAHTLLENNETTVNGMFDTAYKYGTPKQKEKLEKLSAKWLKEEEDHLKEARKKGTNDVREIARMSQRQDMYLQELKQITKEGGAPKVNVKASEFGMIQAAKTFGNLAKKSYEKYGGDSPRIIVENIFEGLGFATAKDHAELIKKSRENFKNYLMNDKDQKKSEKEAEKLSKKFIGANWDMGHVNMAKKKGFTDEYIIKETETIAPYVQHVHVTDNFGFNDSHLAPGMGNVPIKEVLEQLEKHGKIDEMQMIVEAGGFLGQFGKPTHGLSLSAFGSGIHSTGGTANWNQAAGMSGAYSGGFGMLNPEIHHSIYGSGFTSMPTELGGSIAGGQSRFSGNPMA